MEIDRKETDDTTQASGALLSGLEDNFGTSETEDTATGKPAGQAEDAPNPYEGIADHTVSMKPEAWSSDRTPAEGQVARNDHLEGMLRNQGFETSELYTKDENGQTLMDRVAETNNLRDANLITPDQELILPTRHEPKEENSGTASAEIAGETVENLGASAQTEVEAGKVENAEVSSEATASAENRGEGGAYADADARTEVEEAKNSDISARAEATADAASGNEGALATAGVEAGRVEDSTVTTDAVAEADGAIAEARTEVGEAVNSDIVTSAEATGLEAEAVATTEVAEAVESDIATEATAVGPEAEAVATTKVAEAVESDIATEATAVGPEAEAVATTEVAEAVESDIATEATAVGPEAEAVATTKVAEAVESDIATEATAVGPEAVAVATSEVGKADDSTVTSNAQAAGEGSAADAQVVIADSNENTQAAAIAIAEGEGSTADAGVEMNGGYFPSQDGTGTATVVSQADADARGEARGAADASVNVSSTAGEAAAEVDSDRANVELQGQDATAEFEGMNNENSFDVVAEDTVTLHDRGTMDTLGIMGPMYSGNTIGGSALGQDLDLKAKASAGVDVNFTGREGNNDVSASLPGAGSANLNLDLGDGDDTVGALRRDNDQTLIINKESGSLNLNTFSEPGTYQDSTQTVIDAGDATVHGHLRPGNHGSDDTTMLRGSSFGDLTVDGGMGDNDTFVLDLPEGAAVPAVLTREASNGFFGLFANEAEGAIPEGWEEGDAAINAPNYENIVIRQNGEIVGQYGEAGDLPSFEDAKAMRSR